jgi:hypothetical protein
MATVQTATIPVQSTRTLKSSRRRVPAHVAAARALTRTARRLVTIISEQVARGHYLCDDWTDADQEATRAENTVLRGIRARGIAGVVVDGRLYLDLSACEDFDTLCEYRGCAVVVVDLENVPDLADKADKVTDAPASRGFLPAMNRIDAALASRSSRPAAESWPAWTDEDAFALGPEPAEADRAHWAAESGAAHDARQARLAEIYRDGRRMAIAGCTLAVPVCYGPDQEKAAAYARGWASVGEDMEDVERTLAARDRLSWDERAEDAENQALYGAGILPV